MGAQWKAKPKEAAANARGKIFGKLGENGINIDQLVSASRGQVACALFDLPVNVLTEFAMQLSSQPDILKVRVIYGRNEPLEEAQH